MENEQTPAQSEETPQVQAQPEPAANVNEGFQRRIDQLTAKLHEKDEALVEFQRKLLEQVTRPQAAAPVPEADPLAEYGEQLDPIVAKAVKATTQALKQQFEQQMAAQQAAWSAEMNSLQVHNVAAQTGLDVPADVKAKAAQIAKQYRTAPDVALKLAYGEFAMEAAKKVKSVAGYTPPATPVMTGASPAPTPAPKAGNRPANFEALSPAQQVAWFESAGLDDTPL